MAFMLSLFAGRLLQLQGFDASAFSAEAEKDRIRTVTLPAVRGSILDASGVPLATTVDAVNVTADQTKVVDPAATAARLAPLVRRDVATLTADLTGDRRFAYVAKKVTPRTWSKIEALALPGIYAEDTSSRLYPNGDLAGGLVGFVNAAGVGASGLELQLNSLLAGRDGHATFETGAGGRQIPSGTSVEDAPVPGRSVQLTVDRDIQWFAQNAIAAKVKETGSESGTVIVMRPGTGDILAMATAPAVDPRDPGTVPPDQRGNRAVTEAYEPGSTGKVITASALIEEKAITPQTHLVVPNRLTRAGKKFKDFSEHGTEKLTYAGTLAKSSNIGTMLAAERLGLPKLYPYFQKFGIGQQTGLNLPGENDGTLLAPSQWSSTTGYTMTFGQSYSVNTVQMASVFATIANDGVRVQPRLVAGYRDEDGTFAAAPPSRSTRVVAPQTARTVRTMMEAVLSDGGTAPKARVPGYRVAGKTGTAQRFNAACSCYRGNTMSFLGLAPADSPQLVVAVTLQGPRSGAGGGATGGPVFRDVMSFALQSLRIPPTGAAAPKVQLTYN